MNLSRLLVCLLQLHLFTVQVLREVVDAPVFIVQEQLDNLSSYAVSDTWFLIGIVWFAGHVVPDVHGYAVAQAEHIGLSGIENPVVVVAQAEERMVGIEFYLVVALMLAFRIG